MSCSLSFKGDQWTPSQYNYEHMDLNILDKFPCISVIIPTNAQVPSLASGSVFQLPPEYYWNSQSNLSELPCFLVWQSTPDYLVHFCSRSGISLFTKKLCFFTVKLPILKKDFSLLNYIVNAKLQSAIPYTIKQTLQYCQGKKILCDWLSKGLLFSSSKKYPAYICIS